MKPLFLFLLLICSIPRLQSKTFVPLRDSTEQEKRFKELDEYAKKVPKEYEKSLKELADYLMIPAKNETEKARLLFTWVATHIKYDASAYNSGKIKDQSTENVFKSRRSVCEGYSNLLKDLCTLAGLEAVKIIGYSKGYGYRKGSKFKNSDHAWNAIKIEGEWKLMDVTWASGYGKEVDGKMKSVSQFDPYWFDVNPKQFLFTHLPENDKWQLLDDPLTLSGYEKLPKLGDDFFKLGFETDKVYHEAREGTIQEFATIYSVKQPVKAVQLPYTETISRSEATDFVLESEQAADIVLIDGKTWHSFTKEGSTFTLSHKPKHKKVFIGIKKTKNGKSCETLIKYRTKK